MYRKLKECPYCSLTFINISDPRNHIRWCEKNPAKYKINLQDFDWTKIQKTHNDGVNFSDICTQYNINATVLRRAVREGFFKRNKTIFRMSDDAKKRASDRMKALRKKGIGNLSHKKSVPCEYLKTFLLNNGYNFKEEIQPLQSRQFRIDIAFEKNKVGFEINGNQHYESYGKLKEYYQNRHDLIEKSGWKLYELHYSLVYNFEIILNILNNAKISATGRMDIASVS